MIRDLFLSILEISISMSPIVLLFLILRPFLNKRYAAKWNFCIWIFLALQFLLPYHQLLSSYRERLLDMAEPAITQHTAEPVHPVSAAPHTGSYFDIRLPMQITEPVTLPADNISHSITWLDLAASVWLTGCLIFLCAHLLSCLYYQKQIRQKAAPVTDETILLQLTHLRKALHIKHRLSAVTCSAADSPMIAGLFHPVLVLPEDSYSQKELFFILRHELIHFKRGDIYWKLLFVMVNALHWYHPLAWIMQKAAVVDMELSCDEKVVQDSDPAVRKDYTETLLSTLQKHCSKKASLTTQFYGGKQIMKKRFENILTRTPKKTGWLPLLCTMIFTAGSGLLTGCSITNPASTETSAVSEHKDNLQQQALEDSPLPYESPWLPKNSTEILLYYQQESDDVKTDKEKSDDDANTNKEKSDKEEPDTVHTTLASIKKFDGKNMSFSTAEWVDVPSERARELGVEDEARDAGFYVYHDHTSLEILPLSKDCICTILDWYSSYEPKEIPPADLSAVLEERKDTDIPYLLTIQDDKIIKITEHYVP